MRLRILTDLFRQKFVCNTLKYTKYSCGFTPFSDEKSLVRLSCRFMRYCPKSFLQRTKDLSEQSGRSFAWGLSSGRPVEANWVRKQLKAVIQQNHLDPVVFHSLRNSSTSLKLELSKGDIKAVQGDTGHAQAGMVTDVYARTNNTQCKKLARLVEQNFFETMKEKTGDPNFNQTEKIIGLLKEKPEMTENLLNLLSMMVS